MTNSGEEDPVDKHRNPTRRVVVSSLSGFTSNIVVALLAVVSIRLVTAKLGPVHYGSFIIVMTFVTTGSLFADLGVGALTGREIASHPTRVERIIGDNLGLRLSLGTILIPLISIVGLILYGSSVRETSLGIALVSISIPFDAAKGVVFGYLIAEIKNHISYAINTLQQLVYLLGILTCALLNLGIFAFIAAYVTSVIFGSMVAVVVVRREIRVRPLFSPKRWRAIFVSSISLGIIQVINVIYLKADTLILSILGTRHQVGLYGLASVIISFLIGMPSIIMLSVSPIITRASNEQLPRLIRQSLQWMALFSVLVSGVTVFFAKAIIDTLAGSRFDGAVAPLRVLAVTLIFSSFNAVLGFACVARNVHQRFVVVSVLGLVVNVSANIWAIPRFGVVGAAWATFGSEILTLFGASLVFRSRFDFAPQLLRIAVRPLLAGVASLLALSWWFGTSVKSFASILVLSPLLLVLFLATLTALRGIPDGIASAMIARLRDKK